MAITATALYQKTIPSGATTRTDPSVPVANPSQRENVTIAVSGNANASEATGFDNVMTALETYGTGTFKTDNGIDDNETITMVIYVHGVTRQGDQASIWQTGTENYICDCTIQWETA